MGRRIPMLSLTCFTWMGVISWELIQLSHDFRCREEIDHTGSCGNCMAMLNILDIEIYRFTINRFRAFALRYQQALRDLQNCSGAQILVVGKMGVALALEFHVEDLCQLCRASWNLVSCFFQRFSFHKILSDEEYL